MKPESPSNTNSIPPVGISVKNALVSELSGHAVRVHGSGMDVSKETTELEIGDAIAVVRHVADNAKFYTCFCLGDAYSQARRRADIGKSWPGYVKRRFGVKVFNELRGYSWVAEKWPKALRDPSKTWNYHKNNNPPGVGRKNGRPKPPVPLRIIGRHIVDGVEMVHQIDDYGNQYIGKSDGDDNPS